MSLPYEIRPISKITQEDIWPIITGYETNEIYSVEKTETDARICFDFRLVTVETPYRTNFLDDFPPEEIQRYQNLLAQGNSFGAYQQERLIGFALGEVFSDENFLRVWEFHVMAEFRRRGIGRALMERVIAKASQDHLAMILLETQNTNVKAIRFYRSMGFSVHLVDISHYFNQRTEASQTAFYMKRWLEKPGFKE